MKLLVTSLLVLLTASVPGFAQSSAPLLTLIGPRLKVGENVELHRVRGAALLSDGRIAVANGGSASVIVFTSTGAVQKQFGRVGSGPAEFQMLYYLTAIGDTLITWDTGLRRMTLWTADGAVIRTVSLPSITGHAVDVQAVRSPTQYIATLRAGGMRPTSGLYVDSLRVIDVDASKQQPTELGNRAWSYSYFVAEGNGTTTLSTPFLGSTLIASSMGKLLTLPLGETQVEVTRADGSRGSSIMLPLTAPTSRDRARAYGDSLIASVRDQGPRWVTRIQRVFGPEFPPAKQQAVAERAVTVGGTVWFQGFPDARDSTVTWWVVDAGREVLMGRVSLPRSTRVLGGTDRDVLVLWRDNDGVESVALFGWERRP